MPLAVRTRPAALKPGFVDLLPPSAIVEGPLRVTFARTEADLDAVMRLRFDVFNTELHEGLTSGCDTGRDEDAFDAGCHHLMVTDDRIGRIVGTYRLQTSEMAAAHAGFYSATEFHLDRLPRSVLTGGVELGRACVAPDYRNRRALFLLWKGLAAYLTWHRKRYLFGCCSLPTMDASIAWAARDCLVLSGAIHPNYRIPVQPECEAARVTPAQEAPELPSLLRTYLRMGARVCGGPAIDRAFGTSDFLVLLDLHDLPTETVSMFFAPV